MYVIAIIKICGCMNYVVYYDRVTTTILEQIHLKKQKKKNKMPKL